MKQQQLELKYNTRTHIGSSADCQNDFIHYNLVVLVAHFVSIYTPCETCFVDYLTKELDIWRTVQKKEKNKQKSYANTLPAHITFGSDW